MKISKGVLTERKIKDDIYFLVKQVKGLSVYGTDWLCLVSLVSKKNSIRALKTQISSYGSRLKLKRDLLDAGDMVKDIIVHSIPVYIEWNGKIRLVKKK